MKNRRLISFLSLFSLVLVLSVYYVLVPVNNVVIEENGNVSEDSFVSVTDGEDAYFESLELAKVSKVNDDMDELTQVVASSASTIDEKIAALEMIETMKRMSREEEKIKKSILEAGYSNAYVEYEDKVVNVVVAKKDANKSDAATIIKLVYSSVGVSYMPSVSFTA